MEINLLALNVGNSRLAIGTFVAGELEGGVTRVAHDDREEWPAKISEAWERISDLANPAIVGASVNPKVFESLEHVVEKETGTKVNWIGRDIDLPIKVLTEKPSETGVDRVINIAAAYEQMGKACVVVDAGSAITIDVCNDEGEFLGGAIAPGIAMWLESLHGRTAKLPLVKFGPPTGAYGQSTEEAIRQGVYHGIRGMVKELVENYATKLGNWPDLIATGGDAEKLFKDWELVHAISPDLTLYGAALAYTNHHIRHES